MLFSDGGLLILFCSGKAASWCVSQWGGGVLFPLAFLIILFNSLHIDLFFGE
jgi:hypothetical protein